MFPVDREKLASTIQKRGYSVAVGGNAHQAIQYLVSGLRRGWVTVHGRECAGTFAEADDTAGVLCRAGLIINQRYFQRVLCLSGR